jgi:CheY-like chemotaxis protein
MNTPTRILVVDDEPDVEALVTQKFHRQVRKGEMDFLFANDGQHALEILDGAANVDMVLSDINMPRMDGLTLLDRLNERHKDLKTVIVSAYGNMGNIRTATVGHIPRFSIPGRCSPSNKSTPQANGGQSKLLLLSGERLFLAQGRSSALCRLPEPFRHYAAESARKRKFRRS